MIRANRSYDELFSLDIIGRTVWHRRLEAMGMLRSHLRQSFDHDFGGLDDSTQAKALWNQGDQLIVQNLSPAATMVSIACHRTTLRVAHKCSGQIPSFLRMFPWIAHLPLPAIKTQEATRSMMHVSNTSQRSYQQLDLQTRVDAGS